MAIPPWLRVLVASFLVQLPALVEGFLRRSLTPPETLAAGSAPETARGQQPKPLAVSFTEPEFFAPQLTPKQFLFISSPSTRRIVYTELKNFKSLTGRVFVLVDSGLTEPAGLAFDHRKGRLFVADRGAGSIFMYRVLVQEKQAGVGRKSLSLVTDGVQLCIMQGQGVEWVSVDPERGDVFYAGLNSKTVNRITSDVVDALAQGEFHCGDVQIRSEKEQMRRAALAAKAELALSEAERQDALPTDAPRTEPVALSMYEGSINPHLTVPGGVVSDGTRLYWTNKFKGNSAGTVVRGSVSPELPMDSGANESGPLKPFPSVVLTNVTDAAYGITKSNTMVFYSTNTSSSGSVFGVREDGQTQEFSSTFVRPRGLVWDGDDTVYVADEGSNMVFSFPVGRLMDDAPLTQSVAFDGAYGLAMLSASDPAFEHLKAGALGHVCGSFLVRMLALAFALAPCGV